jgi:glycosyltransferase involved in cell wall biosynthesis/tetratricopeptide (TPR) repeat protein
LAAAKDAEALFKVGRYAEAESRYAALCEKHPGEPAGFSGLARISSRRGDWQVALERSQGCIDRFPLDVKPWWRSMAAHALFHLERYDEAEALYQALCVEVPDRSLGYVGLARVSSSRGNWPVALERWQRCADRFPDDVEPWWRSSTGKAMTELGRWSDAHHLYELLCRDYPTLPAGYVGLAQVAVLRCDWGEVVSSWKTCREKVGGAAEASWYSSEAKALIELGHYAVATDRLQELSRKWPDSPLGREGLIRIARLSDDAKTALAPKSPLTDQSPDRRAGYRASQYSSDAQDLIERGQFAEATDLLQELSRKWPGSPLGLEGLTRIALLSDDAANAVSLAKSLTEQFPDRQAGYRWAEDALIQLGRFEEAAHVNLARPNPQPSVTRREERPRNVPAELVLPPVVGEGNDYSFIVDRMAMGDASVTSYSLRVSIVVPVFNRSALLSKTLAALTHQTYPLSLMEVVVADDGSSEPLESVVRPYECYFRTKYVRQDDLGYRLAAVRNLGVRAASHQYFIFLDADVLPSPGLVEAYMKYFHVSDQAVLIGLRRYVCTDGLTDQQVLADVRLATDLPDVNPANDMADWRDSTGRSYDWRLPILAKTNELKSHKQPFRAMAGGNIAIARSALDRAGLFDEEFQAWGAEDQELGFRLYNAGYYFIPVREALGLHQEPPGGHNETNRKAGADTTRPLLESKCPVFRARSGARADANDVPTVSVYMPAYNAERYIQQAVDSALAQSFTDLEVVICDDGSTDRTVQVLAEHYGDHPHVRWASQSHRGIAAASNAAVRMCRGMYIVQLDADDVLKPTAVESAVDVLDQSDVGVVYGGTVMIDEHGAARRPTTAPPFSREWMLVSMVVTHVRVFRKRDWMRTGGFDETLSNAVDYDMFQKLSEVCSFSQLSGVTYGYRYHGTNTSFMDRRVQEANHHRVVEKALERMGLSDEWTAVVGARDNRRNIVIERRR